MGRGIIAAEIQKLVTLRHQRFPFLFEHSLELSDVLQNNCTGQIVPKALCHSRPYVLFAVGHFDICRRQRHILRQRLPVHLPRQRNEQLAESRLNIRPQQLLGLAAVRAVRDHHAVTVGRCGLGGDLGRVGCSKSLVNLIPVFISGFYIVEILRTVLIQSVVCRFTRHPATLPL